MAVKPPDNVIAHWSTLIEGFQTSPLAFYEAVEAALKIREIPQTQNSRVTYKEAGLFSADREYLRVKREKLVFDICAAPFGTGFFFSWWFADDRPKLHPLLQILALAVQFGAAAWLMTQFGVTGGLFATALIVFLGLLLANEMAAQNNVDVDWIRDVPILGRLDAWLFKPGTYYRIDSMDMYQKAVHNALTEVIDLMTTAQGLRALTDSERKPILREYYAGSAK